VPSKVSMRSLLFELRKQSCHVNRFKAIPRLDTPLTAVRPERVTWLPASLGLEWSGSSILRVDGGRYRRDGNTEGRTRLLP
jgi:hypothetical protein